MAPVLVPFGVNVPFEIPFEHRLCVFAATKIQQFLPRSNKTPGFGGSRGRPVIHEPGNMLSQLLDTRPSTRNSLPMASASNVAIHTVTDVLFGCCGGHQMAIPRLGFVANTMSRAQLKAVKRQKLLHLCLHGLHASASLTSLPTA